MEITNKELQEKIYNGEKLIIDFWAPWCQPCGVMRPIFEKISEECRNKNHKVQLFTINVEENKEYALSLGIRSIPTIKSFSDGKEVNSKTGKQTEEQIKQLLIDMTNE
jgi:thioredoxin 1